MTLTHLWNPLLLLLICPLIGGLPLIGWITYALTQQRLSQVGTGNVSVSAAFYHGGKLAGIFAVLSEALKGIAAVLLARALFPNQPVWELIALIALVIGRYVVGKGAGATNVVWGIVAHDWMAAVWVASLGGINFAIFRNRYWGRLAVLILLPIVIGLRHSQETGRIVAAVVLSALQVWIYEKMPEDLELAEEEAKPESRGAFRFFRGGDSPTSLDEELDAYQVGQKAATLSQLKRWGYPVPQGWVLPIAEDAQSLIEALQPSEEEPLVARSSAVEEDVEEASAAGQYETVANITSREELQKAVRHCLESHNKPAAIQYRREHNLPEEGMAVLIQKQVGAVFSGVAFSRDPVKQHGDAVVVEGLPKGAGSVVSGEVTPQQYRVEVSDAKLQKRESEAEGDSPTFPVEGSGDLPPELVRDIAVMAREIENRYNGIPQDIEWSYDGERLWLLQSRPITNLQPIWTRKIAAEVIPGIIHPLTWSINRPLTCGVWGEIFRVVLGDRDRGLNFQETATLHFSRAYFNATLLGEIFQRMGLPSKSLRFLLKGEEFSKPSLGAAVSNLPGLLRLVGREWRLEQDFERDDRERFTPILDRLAARSEPELSEEELLERVKVILQGLEEATYYNILVPLSLSLRQSLLGVEETELDRAQMPEIAAMRSLSHLATESRQTLPMQEIAADSPSDIFAKIREIPEGKPIVEQFEQWLERYGYLSEAETELAAPRWQENPQPLQDLFVQFFTREEEADKPQEHSQAGGWQVGLVQRRVNLKGQVARVYNRLLAHLRWSFLALEKIGLRSGLLSQSGDIFCLTDAEIRRLVIEDDATLKEELSQLVQKRRSQLAQDEQLSTVPPVVYGNEPAPPSPTEETRSSQPQQLQGIAASPGRMEGRIKVMQEFQSSAEIDPQTILVVPHTDAGWAPLLSRAGGLIAEVGGRLSHGAIIARESGIPAVMDVGDATTQLRDGQRVRLDGRSGVVEVLE